MAQGNQVTMIGNLTDDPELRYTPAGVPVAGFTIAMNRRTRDPVSNEWKDGETSFIRCNVWRQQAENVAESLSKGQRAIVVGRLRQRSWETPEGQKRSTIEVEVEHVGPSLEWATASVTKTSRQDGDAAHAFASAGGNGNGGGFSNGAPPDEEPPF
jgi:single-strand DNA-binding protein